MLRRKSKQVGLERAGHYVIECSEQRPEGVRFGEGPRKGGGPPTRWPVLFGLGQLSRTNDSQDQFPQLGVSG